MTNKDNPFKPDPNTTYFPSPKWIRVYFSGKCIADSKKALLVREKGKIPVYFFPREDVEKDYLVRLDEKTENDDEKSFWTVKVGDRKAKSAAWSYTDNPDIKNHIAFNWHKMDAWFEEDEQVHVHARDPFKRVEAIASSREVRVVIEDHIIAETNRPVLLFETGLPTRYYIPIVDIRMDLLVPSKKQTNCPYKGNASYYSIQIDDNLIEDIVWYYPFPTPEMSKLRGLVCFYHEKLDGFYVDGEQI